MAVTGAILLTVFLTRTHLQCSCTWFSGSNLNVLPTIARRWIACIPVCLAAILVLAGLASDQYASYLTTGGYTYWYGAFSGRYSDGSGRETWDEKCSFYESVALANALAQCRAEWALSIVTFAFGMIALLCLIACSVGLIQANMQSTPVAPVLPPSEGYLAVVPLMLAAFSALFFGVLTYSTGTYYLEKINRSGIILGASWSLFLAAALLLIGGIYFWGRVMPKKYQAPPVMVDPNQHVKAQYAYQVPIGVQQPVVLHTVPGVAPVMPANNLPAQYQLAQPQVGPAPMIAAPAPMPAVAPMPAIEMSNISGPALFCSACGSRFEDGGLFCSRCGKART